jgi:4-hydroxy-tetrahydrodipicolinate reductase
MFRIVINGCCGRMGLTVGRLAGQDKALKIASAVEHKGHAALGKDYGELLQNGALGLKVSESIAGPADALIDFSTPEAVLARVPECVKHKIAMVVGTTGFKDDQVKELKKAATKIPILVSSNMSFGVNLLFKITEDVARALGPDFDIEIVETHHRMKKDAPSGTALTLAQGIAEARGGATIHHGRSGTVGERKKGEIGVHAVRGGDIVGEHTIYYIADGESFEITHRARTREIFARGALRISQVLAKKKPGYYSFRDLL